MSSLFYAGFGVIVITVGICAYFLIQTLNSLRDLAETAHSILIRRDGQIEIILENLKSTSESTRDATSRIDETLKTVLAVPNFIENFTREIFSAIFKKEKKGS